MKNESVEFKDLVSSRHERRDTLLADEARDDFWSTVAIWLVLLGLILFGLVGVAWLLFLY
jgi:hypothetical protein